MSKTEIYILAGFLGSGKTTLLKQLLADEKLQGRKVAVMMNELGKISIDSDAVAEDIPLKELLNGCICCTIQDQLESQLQGLLFEEKPDVIYIETTGAAHPVEVLDAVLSPLFANQLDVRGIITIIDGKRWIERKALSPQLQQLLLEQASHADILILNKSDLISESEQAQLTYELQGLNPHALSILTTNASVPIAMIKKHIFRKKGETVKTHVHIDLNLSTFVYTFHHPIEQAEFEDFLRSLPDTIYRIKGYIQFSYSDLPYLFQFSYGMPLYMKEDMNLPLNLVFIGENINWDLIQNQLEKLENKG